MAGNYNGSTDDIEKQLRTPLLPEEKLPDKLCQEEQEEIPLTEETAEDKQLLEELQVVKPNKGYGEKVIRKVPEITPRDGDFKRYFKPKELAIGPIHAANPKLIKKELKLKLAAHFIEISGRTGAFLLAKVKSEIKDIKMDFEEEVSENSTDEKLIRLVFLDGCAILGFIDRYVNRTLSSFNISNGQATLIQQDIFLLENQIPFRVLKVLIASSIKEKGCELKNEILKFIVKSSSIVLKDSTNLDPSLLESSVHFLDLLRSVLLVETISSHQCHQWLMRSSNFFDMSCSQAILSALFPNETSSYRIPENWSRKQSFRNVQEIKTAGIKFKPSDSLRDISFHSRLCISGRLKLPTLVVDNSTPSMLLNLVAYEMSMSRSQTESDNLFPSDHWVTSYINLLDLLIDNEEDVKDLRAADIVRNCLSSDVEVARLINSLGSYCFAPSQDTYAQVKFDIEKHYRRRCAIWMAQVYHSHFSNPWTILALFTATVVIALTVLQTWYTVNPEE